jgi:hypothetical protein
MSTAVDEKTEGQTRSGSRVPEEKVQAFFDSLRAIPVGADVSVNEVRDRLDELAIPTVARAGLFYRAACEGLIEALTLEYAGYATPVKVPSTGRTAHRALVQVYRRSDTS